MLVELGLRRHRRRLAMATLSLMLAGIGVCALETAGRPKPIAKSEYAARRAAIRELLGDSIAVIAGGTDDRLLDRERFRQYNDFYYLTGVEDPGATLVLLPKGSQGPRELLFVKKQQSWEAVFVGDRISPGASSQAATGIGAVRAISELDAVLGAELKLSHSAFVSSPEEGGSAFDQRLKKLDDTVKTKTIAPMMANARVKKSDAELNQIRAAIDATAEAHRRAALTIRPGVDEGAVEGAIQEAFRRGGASRDAFPSIVGSGPNSCVLHYDANNRVMKSGDLVVVDIGAEYEYYCADVTRTFPVSGKFSERQLKLYLAVLRAQQAGEKAARLGASIGDVESAARASLRNSGLSGLTADGKEQPLDEFFSHGVGHYLGMDVHDVGPGGPIPIGGVFTIEPGVYIKTEQTGIRIEDDYVMTPNGAIKLSGKFPSNPWDLEKAMRSANKSG
jgi:Xaa-Pro aminopeptidase